MELDINTYKTETLIPREEILRRVMELGTAISEEYEGKPLVLIGVLNGAAFFLSDLARTITIPLEIDFIRASSYGDKTESHDPVAISYNNIGSSLTDKYVILVEDIVDTGKTITALTEFLKEKGALSIAICALIDKKERRENDVVIDYVGFEVEEGFLVGYGLDYAEKFRQLPDICSLFKEDLIFINCGQCDTTFKVKSSLIDEYGTIVRCSVCKHTFKAYADGSQAECPITELEPLPEFSIERILIADIHEDDNAQKTDSDESTAEKTIEITIIDNISSDPDELEERDEDNEEPASLTQIIAEKDDNTEPIAVEVIQEDADDAEYPSLGITEEDEKDEEIKKPARRLLNFLLFLVFALCAVLAFLFFIPQDLIPSMFRLYKADLGAQYDPGTKNLSFEEIVGAFVDSPDNSRFFVIRGFVRNNYSKIKHSILLTASILDNNGNNILKQNSYAGIKTKDEQLSAMSELERSELIKKGDRETFVEPGSRIPFLMIFDNLPNNVEEFTVEFISAFSAE